MKKIAFQLSRILFGIVILLSACKQGSISEQKTRWKEEVIQTETDFAAMAAEEGIGNAFVYYAADDAVLMRSNKLIKGKEAIAAKYGVFNSEKVKLSWKPDFVEVSGSGDLAYTYGQYIYSVIDSLGEIKSDTGVFHTVWKRQPDGNWKFVWD
nr:nuclear transport factor 2 family protein [uncultured Carboxylicivirga sp.]